MKKSCEVRRSDLTLHNTHPHGVQRIVLVPAWAEPIAEAKKCLFVDLVEYLHACLPNHFILQGQLYRWDACAHPVLVSRSASRALLDIGHFVRVCGDPPN